jgi:hypothetical protein
MRHSHDNSLATTSIFFCCIASRTRALPVRYQLSSISRVGLPTHPEMLQENRNKFLPEARSEYKEGPLSRLLTDLPQAPPPFGVPAVSDICGSGEIPVYLTVELLAL